jgi:hypothetical protein
MPKDLVDDYSAFPPIVRVPVDGDDANGANFELPYQQLANRTAYLLSETETKGARRLRRVAKIDDLRTDPAGLPSELRWIDGYGLFAWDPAAVIPDDPPWFVQSSVTTGGWFNLLRNFRASVLMTAWRLDAHTVTSTTYVDLPLMSLVFPAVDTGNTITAHLTGRFATVFGTGGIRLIVIESDGTMSSGLDAGEPLPIAAPNVRVLQTSRRVVKPGPVTVKVQARAAPSGSLVMSAPTSLIAELNRLT